MTLIITAANKNCLFQTSDMRLTDQNGKLHDDFSVKQTQVRGNHFCFLTSYTGVAYIKNVKVHDWLTNELSNYKIGNKGPEDIVTFLREKLNETYTHKGNLILTGIGWSDYEDIFQRFYFSISNVDSNCFVLDKKNLEDSIFLKCDGYLPATQEDYFNKRSKKVRKFMKREKKGDRKLITDKLVDLIRIGANHKLHGKFIGKNVTGIYVGTYDFSPIARYYSAEKTIVYLPNSVSNEMAVKGIKITQSDQRDSFFKINPKDNG
ncbi:MAG: hypothetical protein UT12_C0023G0004 [Candidatus Curtissbacteria bacterium GW2011_GWC2_38_9]|uniref:Uncharacterized protein n=4 Tax=Candidatus Curtissiibacteriota TaxID=1752717 RepID=A0A0G0PG69_9BACT|nr:MAG: hypothetical protein UT12_C0023G0004 [Candidatus Curtissbacteria bacterium GW2011_GWC2_38_9]